MLGYGFSISHNPFDHYAVGFSVPPGSPLEEARAWRASQSTKANKKNKPDDQYRYYIFNADHPRAKTAQCLEASVFSQDLFDGISILSANLRELGSDRFRMTGSILDLNSRGSMDIWQHRNLLHTLSQLRVECSSRLNMIREMDPGMEVMSTAAMSTKQQYAKRYRDSQLLILETAALLCAYCLSKAQYPQRQDSVLVSAAAEVKPTPQTPDAIVNIQKLVVRTQSTVKIRTLFTFSDVLELLPGKLAAKIREVAKVFREQLVDNVRLSSKQRSGTIKAIEEKINFTVFLAALRKIFLERSEELPSLLKSWMRRVQKWYPFDDQFWNGPTEEFLSTLETLLEAADQLIPDTSQPVMDEVWSDPRMICWGWNVQEEEGLFSDTELLEVDGDVAAYQPSTFLLCIAGAEENNGA